MSTIRTIFALLLLIPSLSWGESYVCASKCYMTDEICQTTYTRDNKVFKDNWGQRYMFVEDKKNLAMASIFANEEKGSAIFSVIIDKPTLKFTKSTTQVEEGGTGYLNGTCSIIK